MCRAETVFTETKLLSLFSVTNVQVPRVAEGPPGLVILRYTH